MQCVIICIIFTVQTKTNKTMKQENLYGLKIGDKIDSYYGNGSFSGRLVISRITDSSCFWKFEKYIGTSYERENRESWNTVNTSIKEGLYKLVHTSESL